MHTRKAATQWPNGRVSVTLGAFTRKRLILTVLTRAPLRSVLLAGSYFHPSLTDRPHPECPPMSAFEERSVSYPQAERAIVFADVCRSTQLFERHGNAQALRIVGRALTVLSDVTHRHGGTVVKTIGDEVMATFDDAEAAAEAVVAAGGSLLGEPEEFGYGELVLAAGPDGERFAMTGPRSEDWDDHSWSRGLRR